MIQPPEMTANARSPESRAARRPGSPEERNAAQKKRENGNRKDDSLREIRKTEEYAEPKKGPAILPMDDKKSFTKCEQQNAAQEKVGRRSPKPDLPSEEPQKDKPKKDE